jgi:aminoglycoside phosphotransferase (APT) family kinase protein
MTLLHGDCRADNIFKAKADGAFTFIDWQMITSGPIGCELLQLASASMSDPADYKKMNTLVEHYYDVVMSGAPDMKADYSLQQVQCTV